MKKTEYKPKKISYSPRLNGVSISIDCNENIPVMYNIIGNNSLWYEATNTLNNTYKQKNVFVDQSDLNKYTHTYVYGSFRNGFPAQINGWKDSQGTVKSMMFMMYNFNENITISNEFSDTTTSDLSYTTITAPNEFATYYLIDSTVNSIDMNSFVINTVFKSVTNSGAITRQNNNIFRIECTSNQYPLLPYPKAIVRQDTNEYYLLHSPDTVYTQFSDSAIRVTKHNKNSFEVLEHFVPTISLQGIKKFVPISIAVSENGFAIVGTAIDSFANSVALTYYNSFDEQTLKTTIGSIRSNISSCRVREDGTISVVGAALNGKNGSEDFYLGVVKPSWTTIEEFVWGDVTKDALSDVTYVDKGDIVITGNVGPNFYASRISIDQVTNIESSLPFSASIGFAPNPASSQTLVRFAPTTDGIATAELFDMRGMKVKQLFSEPVQRGNEYTFSAPVSDVPNGVYTVIITNGITKHHQQLQIIR
ncbi:MAG: T9SS type A sorting domain-containing protein [Candidatus Kapabacteria bacterium]|nr:T9SS type A sorting domain-containing protein [Candidatus Kapabacteria bacterium]